MKKTYETLSFMPLHVVPESEILTGSIKMLAANVTVEKYQDGFADIDGAISGFGGNSFSEVGF